jgi:hypothetical protein
LGCLSRLKWHRLNFLPTWVYKTDETGEQEITPLYLVSQSIPKITSIPSDLSMVRSALNSSPPIRILTNLQIMVQLSSPRGELVTMGLVLGTAHKDSLAANLEGTEELVAPESKRTVAIVLLTKNSPSTTSDAS